MYFYEEMLNQDSGLSDEGERPCALLSACEQELVGVGKVGFWHSAVLWLQATPKMPFMIVKTSALFDCR